MTFERNFCASPWLHMRINNQGHYEYCRWATKSDRTQTPHIRSMAPLVFFQQHMSPIRQAMLAGEPIDNCRDCHIMEQHHKVSGRQRQLLKIGVTSDNFTNSMLSSPWLPEFTHTQHRQGVTAQSVRDWQIDLGNFCNSACVFCTPSSSSRLAAEFQKIGIIDQVPVNAWCDDADLLEKFVSDLGATPDLTYLHFIGGETLITPAFRKILSALIHHGISSRISIGLTTNLTVWEQDIVELLCEFKEVNLGMSIECFHALNDYVRWPSSIETVKATLQKWQELQSRPGWLFQLRVTPTVLSIWHLHTVYEHALQIGMSVESCNFLDQPAFMRASVLPRAWRQRVIQRLEAVLLTNAATITPAVINVRNPHTVVTQLQQDLNSYVDYLRNADDESHRLPELVRYLKRLEASRDNCLLDYLPEYEKLLRSVGY